MIHIYFVAILGVWGSRWVFLYMNNSATPAPLRNDIIAGQIMAAIASTPRPLQRMAVLQLLDRHYSSRSATAAGTSSHGAARTGDKPTAQLAAAEVNVRPQELAVLRCLARHPKAGLTALDISTDTSIPLNSISTRMKSLVVRRLISEVGVIPVNGHKRIQYKIGPVGVHTLEEEQAA
jgi:hypothetical protein